MTTIQSLYAKAQLHSSKAALELNKFLQVCYSDSDIEDSSATLHSQLHAISGILVQLEAELPNLPEHQRVIWRTKINTLVTNWDNMNTQIRKAREEQSRRQQRKELFGSVDASDDVKLLVDEADEARSLHSSLRMTNEFIESSKSSLSSLIQQREWMSAITNKLKSMNSITRIGGNMVRSTRRRLKQDFVFVVFLIVIVLVVLWLVLKLRK
ncbi:hypothetical protein P9112_003651 [Eukaryota sp. TZLM1-RC]